ELAKRVIPSEKVKSISIAEMNPTYDTIQQISNLLDIYSYFF
ncbi:formimidoylglutamase, partial [Staphylococcus epidermidis]|nr:formimidoylglutamase [Staphylococcus epidermidis]